MEEEFINEYNSALGSLNHQHKQQFEDFDNFPDVLPVSYCKACAHALQLREQERHLCMRAFVYISMLDYLIHQIIKNLISQFLNTHYLWGKKIVLYTAGFRIISPCRKINSPSLRSLYIMNFLLQNKFSVLQIKFYSIEWFISYRILVAK